MKTLQMKTGVRLTTCGAWIRTLIAATSMLALAQPIAYAADNTTGPWKHLFDGESMAGWREVRFGGRGEVAIEQGELRLGMGAILTGVVYTNDVPRTNYEISLEAKRTMGTDFFCGLTVPVGETNCTLIVGGWGGGVVGISSLDYYDASENETTFFRSFTKDQWYDIRMRVTPEMLQVWMDGKEVIDAPIKERKVGMRAGEIEMCVPLGVAAYQTAAALRNIRVRTVTGPEK
jgi:hypothetical protein